MSEQGFWEFYEASYRQVASAAYAHVGNRADAEDLAQAAFLDCLRSWDRVANYENPRAWVIGAALRRSISAYRRRQVAQRLRMKLAMTDAQDLGDVDVRLDVLALVRMLSPKQRAVVVLYYLADQPVDNVAHLLGLTSGTVKTHLSRARVTMAELLQEANQDEPTGKH